MKRLALLPVLLVVALAGPAAADSVVVTDPIGDAEAIGFDPDPDSCEPPTVESAGANDIRRLVVRHTADRVVMTLRVARLGRPRDTVVQFRVRTPRRQWDVSISRWAGRYGIDLTPPPPPVPDLEPGDCHSAYTVPVRTCRGSVGRMDPGAGIVRISLTRACLGDPRWVQLRADVTTWVHGLLITDDVPRLGPRVYAGTR